MCFPVLRRTYHHKDRLQERFPSTQISQKYFANVNGPNNDIDPSFSEFRWTILEHWIQLKGKPNYFWANWIHGPSGESAQSYFFCWGGNVKSPHLESWHTLPLLPERFSLDESTFPKNIFIFISAEIGYPMTPTPHSPVPMPGIDSLRTLELLSQ